MAHYIAFLIYQFQRFEHSFGKLFGLDDIFRCSLSRSFSSGQLGPVHSRVPRGRLESGKRSHPKTKYTKDKNFLKIRICCWFAKFPSNLPSPILQVPVSRKVTAWSSAKTTSAISTTAGPAEKEGRLKEKRSKSLKKAQEAKVPEEARLKKSFIDSNPTTAATSSSGHNTTCDNCTQTSFKSAPTPRT